MDFPIRSIRVPMLDMPFRHATNRWRSIHNLEVRTPYQHHEVSRTGVVRILWVRRFHIQVHQRTCMCVRVCVYECVCV